MKTITGYAKHHRKNPTKAEAKLKKMLLKWKISFRSQRQFDYYIVDFLIQNKRLVIEVDGGYHSKTTTYDKRRESYLRNVIGLEIIRVTNDYILKSDGLELRDKILSFDDIDIRKLELRKSYGIAKY
jgi:very-short-patch-repair endonuclease